MYDPKRISSRAFVLLGLAAAVGLVGAAVRPVLGGRPSWLRSTESTVETPLFRKAAGRVVAVGRDLARSATTGHEQLGVLAGGSSLIHGVDPPRMDTGPEWRWLSLAPTGAYVLDDCDLIDLAIKGGLRPAIVVVVVNASHLAMVGSLHDDPTTFDTDDLRFHVRRHEWFKAQTDVANLLLVPWNLAFPNRTRISGHLRQKLFTTQQDMFEAMGYPPLAPYEPDPTPWTVTFPYPGAERMPDGWMEYVYRGFQKHRMFEPTSYSAEGPGVRALADLTRHARSTGAEVVVVLMAEGSNLRGKMPREAVQTLRDGLRTALGDSGPILLDLRDAVADKYFLDELHLSEKGRAAFTQILSDRLRQILASPRQVTSNHEKP